MRFPSSVRWIATPALACLAWACSQDPQQPDPLTPLPDLGDRMAESAASVFAAADSYRFFALHPYPHEEAGDPEAGPSLHGYRILGEAAPEAAGDGRAALHAIYRDALRSEGMVAACFNPRHGLRAEANGRTAELVICFECLSMLVYVDGERADQVLIGGQGDAPLTEIFGRAGLTIHRNG